MDVVFTIPVVPSISTPLSSTTSSNNSIQHNHRPLGMLARTHPPVVVAKPVSSRIKLMDKLHRASVARRDTINRVVTSVRSHLNNVENTVQKNNSHDIEKRQRIACKLRRQFQQYEVRRNQYLSQRTHGNGNDMMNNKCDGKLSQRSRSSTSLSSLMSIGSNDSTPETVALKSLKSVITEFVALDLIRNNDSSRSLDDLTLYIENPHTLDITRRLLNEIAFTVASFPEPSSRISFLRNSITHTPSSTSTTPSLSSVSLTPSEKSIPSDEGIQLDLLSNESNLINSFDARMFLAALATTLFPTQVLRPGNEMDDNLFQSTTTMMSCFSKVIERASLRRLHEFINAWTIYVKQFNDWKLASQQILLQELIQHYIDVDILWMEARIKFNNIPPSSQTLASSLEYLQGLRNRQKIILNRLIRFGGIEAKEALIRSRHAAKVDKYDLINDSNDVLLGSTTLSGKNTHHHSVLFGEPSWSDESEQPTSIFDTLTDISIRDLQVAHDLYLDGTNNSSSNKTSMEMNIHVTLKRAFLDQKLALFREGQWLPWVTDNLLLLCQNVSKSTLVPSATMTKLEGICDIEWITNRIKASNFTAHDLVEVLLLISKFMRTICAPARDIIISAAEQLRNDPVSMLFSLIDASQVMNNDMSNIQLIATRPALTKTLISLEKSQFSKLLNHGQLNRNLPRTHTWFTSAINEYHHSPITDYRQVWNIAMVQLLLNLPQDKAKIPETFWLDYSRLESISERIHRLLLTASIITHSKAYINDNNSCNSTNLGPVVTLVQTNRINEAVHLLLDTINQTAINGTTGKDLIDALQTKAVGISMTNTVIRCLNKTDPVYKLLVRRMSFDLKTALSSISSVEMGSRKLHISKGLDVLNTQLTPLIFEIIHFATHNRTVHAELYDNFLNDINKSRELLNLPSEA